MFPDTYPLIWSFFFQLLYFRWNLVFFSLDTLDAFWTQDWCICSAQIDQSRLSPRIIHYSFCIRCTLISFESCLFVVNRFLNSPLISGRLKTYSQTLSFYISIHDQTLLETDLFLSIRNRNELIIGTIVSIVIIQRVRIWSWRDLIRSTLMYPRERYLNMKSFARYSEELLLVKQFSSAFFRFRRLDIFTYIYIYAIRCLIFIRTWKIVLFIRLDRLTQYYVVQYVISCWLVVDVSLMGYLIDYVISVMYCPVV